MRTEIIKVNSNNINPVYIKTAAEKIENGGLVAFPTETVYGLGADALNPKAVAKIFEAKKRPLEDPLIVHIVQREELFKLAKNIPDIVMEGLDSDFSTREWFIAPMKKGNIHVSNLYTSKITKKLCITVSAPIRNKKKEIVGILGIDMKFDDLAKL